MGIGHSSLVQNLQKDENGAGGESMIVQETPKCFSLEMVCRDAKALVGYVECNKRTAKRMTGLEQHW